jgi:hypothetical protein
MKKLWPDCVPLAKTIAITNGPDTTCIWVNTYGKARVFGTTLGHDNKTVGRTALIWTWSRAGCCGPAANWTTTAIPCPVTAGKRGREKILTPLFLGSLLFDRDLGAAASLFESRISLELIRK